MHELALADAVIATALEIADAEGFAELVRIDVCVGELQQIQKETFEFVLTQVMPAAEPRLASTQLGVEIEPARFRCRRCELQFGLHEHTGLDGAADAAEAIHFIPELAHAFLRCPECGSPDFQVTEGRGVSIRSIDGRV